MLLKYPAIAATIAMPLILPAQSLISATERCWSGGVAGKHGCNYTFCIEFKSPLRDVQPDTLWIGEQPIRLIVKKVENTGDGNTKVSLTRNGIRLDIMAGTHFDDHEDLYPHAPRDSAQPLLPKPPLRYTGVALLSYMNGGKHGYFVIKKVTNKYPHVSYP